MGIRHLQGVFCQETILGKEKKHNEREAGIVHTDEVAFLKVPLVEVYPPQNVRKQEDSQLPVKASVGDWVEVREGPYAGRHGELVMQRMDFHGKGMQYRVQLEERYSRGRRLLRVVQKLIATKNIKLLQHRKKYSKNKAK